MSSPEYICPACDQPLRYHDERSSEDVHGRERIYLTCPPAFPVMSDLWDAIISFSGTEQSKTRIGFIVTSEVTGVERTFTADLDKTEYDKDKDEIFLVIREVQR